MDVFDLFAKITLDKSNYDKGLDEASKNTSSFGSKLQTGLSTAGKIAAAGMATTATAIVGLGTKAVGAYAEFEQLEGGVKKIFGAESAKTVMAYAEEAYKNAGLSANNYLNTVTSFSASLLQGLGGDTAKAAEVANTAVEDMADNANTFGTSMDSIQNAYAGFAKNNYTMLDNLKLGYGGTAAEMAILVNDSGVMGDSFVADAKNINEVSFDKIIEAIHTVQENMDITGTTSKEASGTISGSIATMKGAWTNFVSGMANSNADMSKLTDDLITSIQTVGDNILPVIEGLMPRLVAGFTQLITSLMPQIIPLIQMLLPAVLDGTTALFNAVIAVLPDLMNTVVAALPIIIDALLILLPQLTQTALTMITTLATGLASALPTMVPQIIQIVLQIVQTLIDNLPMILDAALQLITGLAEGLINSIPVIIEALPQIITSMVDYFITAIPKIIEVGVKLLSAIIENLPAIISAIAIGLAQIIKSIIDYFKNNKKEIVSTGENILKGIWEGIQNMVGWFKDKFTGWAKGIWGDIKNVFGIHSPSKKFAEIGEYLALGLGAGWDDAIDGVSKDIQKSAQGIIPEISTSISATGTKNNSGTGNYFGDIVINFTSTAENAEDIAKELGYQLQRQLRTVTVL